jgi:hypothetical protein
MSYGFVAYFDESGDDGLKRVRPMHPTGSSEWFVLSAMVVRASNESAVGRWQQDIRAKIGQTQRTDIHYRDLSPTKRLIACTEIATRPVRCFVAMSNKKNMPGYANPRCWQEKNYFYWWMTRLLLERLTAFCAKQSRMLYGGPRPIKMIFSQRGGMTYERLTTYLNLLRFENEIGHVRLDHGMLDWSVVDLKQIRDVAHKNDAGLQLADCSAGAFYQAVSLDGQRQCQTDYATALIPRLYRSPRGRILGYGVKVMPQFRLMKLLPQQRAIFEALGFPPSGW